MSSMIQPGSTIGFFGGGQLGRMSAMAAKRMGYRVMVFDPEANAPAAQITDRHFCHDYFDEDAVTSFAKQADVITFEFENIPIQTLQTAEKQAAIHPHWDVLEIIQNRNKEKSFVQKLGIDPVPFQFAKTVEECKRAANAIGIPSVAKTVHGGYDGKGQIRLYPDSDVNEIWQALGESELVIEKWIDLELEFSVIIARDANGSHAEYGPIHNEHKHHILDCSACPFTLDENIANQAKESIQTIAESMNFTGVLCVEFFLSRDGKLYFNEMASRPHNSGHLTIEGHRTSQFEQHIRSICGLPLGSAEQTSPAVMVNLLGDIWTNHQPHWSPVFFHPSAYLHLYGKTEAKPGRKMGHITVLSDSVASAKQDALQLRSMVY